MLVLTRRESDKVLFPSLGISVEVLRIQGNRTRLGITAPCDVPILRHEVADLRAIEFAPGQSVNDDRLKTIVYAIRHRLEVACVSLNQLHTALDGQPNDSLQTLIENLFNELRMLECDANQVLEDSGITINQTPRALLVDECASERQLLGAFLELSGFDVAAAQDGQDALDYLSLHARPDVVILDMMPVVDGSAFVRAVRADPKLQGLSIFAMTDATQEALEVPTGPDGVDRWYEKPIDPNTLVSDVATYLTNAPVQFA